MARKKHTDCVTGDLSEVTQSSKREQDPSLMWGGAKFWEDVIVQNHTFPPYVVLRLHGLNQLLAVFSWKW